MSKSAEVNAVTSGNYARLLASIEPLHSCGDENTVNSMKSFRGSANLQRLFASHPLTCDAPLQAWFRFAVWQMRSRLQHEVLIDWVGGQRLAVQHGMTGATCNIYVGLHEFLDMMVPLHFLRSDDLFLDVGANVGTYTVLASGVRRARTCAFEPDPDTLGKLKRNVDINRLSDRVQVYECALGATRGEAAFTVGLDTVNRLATANDKTIRTVRMETLDHIVSDSHPVMMKVDVEGAELDVLKGAEQLLANPSLKIIEMETAVGESAGILSRNGFETACYDPFHRMLTRNPTDCRSSNTLFVREWPFVADRLQNAEQIEVLGRKI